MAVDLEAGLRELAASLDFPHRDELASRVVAALSEAGNEADRSAGAPDSHETVDRETAHFESAHVETAHGETAHVVPLRRRPVVRRVAGAVAAAVLLVALALAVSGRARHAVADLLGIGGIEIRSGPSATSAAPPTPATPPLTGSSSPTTTEAGSAPTTGTSVPPASAALPELGLGAAVEPTAAARELGIPTPVPPTLGSPDAAYFATSPPGGELSLVWRPTATLPPSQVPEIGALLSVFRGHADDRFITKILSPGTTYERVQVNGRPAVWLAGAPHEFLYSSPDGTVSSEPLRLAGNTLIWTNGAYTYRLESGLDRAAAIELAQTVPV